MNKPEQFTIGEKIVCKNYFKSDKITYNKNIEYQIISIIKGVYTIENVSNGEEYQLKTDVIHNNFISALANTCHAFQGSSTDDKITIFDYTCEFITQEWLYVAITRTTDFNNVYYYTGPSLFQFRLENFAQNKIMGYKEQDMKANRPITNDDYLNIEWFKKNLKSNCYICGETMTMKTFTADRLNNNLPHTNDNCMACCLSCNVKKITVGF